RRLQYPVRALRPADRGARPGGPVCGVCERRHEKSVTDRAARGHRDHPPAGGVSHAHPRVDAAGIAEYGPYRGCRVGRCLVPADLSHRAEDRVRMAQVAALLVLGMAGGADTVRATVVRSDPPQYRLPDGRYLLSQPGEPLVPAELVRTTPEATITLEATQARSRTELAYVAGGAAHWQAVYQVVLGG